VSLADIDSTVPLMNTADPCKGDLIDRLRQMTVTVNLVEAGTFTIRAEILP